MEKYYFKTRFQPPDEECIEKCNVRKDGTMIGSYNCITCKHHVENNLDGYNEMTWLKCAKLEEAISEKGSQHSN